MEYLEGDILSYEKWKSCSEDAQTKICASISEQLRLFRSVPAEGYYGRVNKQGWRPHLSLLRSRCQEVSGSYDTYEDFASAVSTSTELTATMCSFTLQWHPIEESCLSTIMLTLLTCTGRQPTLTHMDPGPKNIIVRQVKGKDSDDDDWEATFIDWADCGWYPAYMQTVAFHLLTDMIDMGPFCAVPEAEEQFLSKILQNMEDPYTEQVSLFKKLDDKLAHGLL
jgi:hypothetical protein